VDPGAIGGMIVALDDPTADLSEPRVGGKAAGLARLIALGLPVPPAVVVPVEDGGSLEGPAAVAATLGERLAVRSSAPGEDARDRSAAGQYETVLGVRPADLPRMVKQVHDSASSERVRAYRGGSDPAGMAVVIQREVPASRAGVAFSRDPVSGEGVTVVECIFGGGDALVSGLAAPDRFVVDRDGGIDVRLGVRDGPTRLLRTLRDDEVRAVAELVRRAEQGFGHAVDVEFCFERARPWLVQCRAVTGLERAG
jgi:phosphoenolpyruvate synthase/pyruvate phosphate dikinase